MCYHRCNLISTATIAVSRLLWTIKQGKHGGGAAASAEGREAQDIKRERKRHVKRNKESKELEIKITNRTTNLWTCQEHRNKREENEIKNTVTITKLCHIRRGNSI